MTAEVLVMEHVAGVTAGTAVDGNHNNTTARHHRYIRSISRNSNNRTTSSQRCSNNSICSRNKNKIIRSRNSNIIVPRDFVRDVDSPGTSQTCMAPVAAFLLPSPESQAHVSSYSG